MKLPAIFDPLDLALWLVLNEPSGGFSTDTLESATSLVGRNAAPALLWELHEGDLLSRAHYVSLVGSVWTGAEWPLRQLDGDEWRELFRWAGFTRTDEDGRGRRWPRPRKPVQLYRGSDEANRCGWSWSTDVATARWFATRPHMWPAPGQVWTTTVQPSALLARIDERNEAEYVLDGRDLDPGAVVPL